MGPFGNTNIQPLIRLIIHFSRPNDDLFIERLFAIHQTHVRLIDVEYEKSLTSSTCELNIGEYTQISRIEKFNNKIAHLNKNLHFLHVPKMI